MGDLVGKETLLCKRSVSCPHLAKIDIAEQGNGRPVHLGHEAAAGEDQCTRKPHPRRQRPLSAGQWQPRFQLRLETRNGAADVLKHRGRRLARQRQQLVDKPGKAHAGRRPRRAVIGAERHRQQPLQQRFCSVAVVAIKCWQRRADSARYRFV